VTKNSTKLPPPQKVLEGKISWVGSSHLGYSQLDWNGVRFLERELRSRLFLKNRIWNQIPSSTSLRDWNQNRNRSNFFKNENRRFFTKVKNRPTLVYTYLIPIQIPGFILTIYQAKDRYQYLPFMKIFLGVKFYHLVKNLKIKKVVFGVFFNAKFYG